MAIDLATKTSTSPQPNDRFFGLRLSGSTPAEKAIEVPHSELLNPTGDIDYAGHRAKNVVLRATAEDFQNLGVVAGAVTIDLAAANVFKVALSGDVTFSFIGVPPSGLSSIFTLHVIKIPLVPPIVSADITWPASVIWGDDGEPVFPGIGRVRLAFTTDDGGIAWDGKETFRFTEEE